MARNPRRTAAQNRVPFVVWGGVALVILGVVASVVAVQVGNRSAGVWVVDIHLRSALEHAISAVPNAPDWPVLSPDSDELDAYGTRRYGVHLTDSASVQVGQPGLVLSHHNLARWGNPNDGFVVAVDPWLVFRRHSTPPLLRERVEEVASPPVTGSSSRSWPGTLILPGADTAALQAWTAQLLQEAPGRFESNPEEWEVVRSRLTRSGRFQRGALTYDWEDVWPRLLGNEQVWLYAPLSRVQQLPGDRTSALEADVFPIPESWNEYGLQARLLWATPINMVSWLHRTRIDRELEAAREWLQSPETQSQIASALKWTPAHRLSRAATPLSATAHRFWIGSSFIWEDISHNGELGSELVGKKGETLE